MGVSFSSITSANPLFSITLKCRGANQHSGCILRINSYSSLKLSLIVAFAGLLNTGNGKIWLLSIESRYYPDSSFILHKADRRLLPLLPDRRLFSVGTFCTDCAGVADSIITIYLVPVGLGQSSNYCTDLSMSNPTSRANDSNSFVISTVFQFAIRALLICYGVR